MRVKLADPGEERDIGWADRLERHRDEVEHRLAKIGAMVDVLHGDQDYAYRVTFRYSGDLKPLADYVEDVPGCEVLSLGHSLEIIKDLSDAESVAERYKLNGFTGTHAIGHVRMATESDVDISGAHPYWAYPFSDIAVVHNGQLTNYHMWRRRLERMGHRFQSECDSEIIAVYLARRWTRAVAGDAMTQSLDELDGVFTYICVTGDALGVAKDEMAAKPLVLYESTELVALASEEVAIRASSTARSTPTTRTRARCWCGTGERDQLRRPRPGEPTRTRRDGHRGSDGDGRVRRARADDAQINLELRRLVYERASRRHDPQPGREALARRGHPAPLPDHLRRQPRLLRLRADRRAGDHVKGRVGWSVART
jgi:hypothetical protein